MVPNLSSIPDVGWATFWIGFAQSQLISEGVCSGGLRRAEAVVPNLSQPFGDSEGSAAITGGSGFRGCASGQSVGLVGFQESSTLFLSDLEIWGLEDNARRNDDLLSAHEHNICGISSGVREFREI